MILGGGIVLFYWIFDWEPLVSAGFLLLPVGTLAVLNGLLFVIIWAVQRHRLAKLSNAKFPLGRLFGLILLLISNFGVALVCVFIGASLVMQPSVQITVTNDSGAVLDKCLITSNWSWRSPATLAPGEFTSATIKDSRAAGLRLHLEQAGKSKDIPLTSPGGGGGLFDSNPTIKIQIQPNLEVDIESTPGG